MLYTLMEQIQIRTKTVPVERIPLGVTRTEHVTSTVQTSAIATVSIPKTVHASAILISFGLTIILAVRYRVLNHRPSRRLMILTVCVIRVFIGMLQLLHVN
jgi:hypothetical protein